MLSVFTFVLLVRSPVRHCPQFNVQYSRILFFISPRRPHSALITALKRKQKYFKQHINIDEKVKWMRRNNLVDGKVMTEDTENESKKE